MRIYQITPLGRRVAGSIKAGDTPAMKVLRYLAMMGSASKDQIQNYTGLDDTNLGMAIRKLRSRGNPFITEV
jgi:DNA-binding MarR family transcriptional regulator